MRRDLTDILSPITNERWSLEALNFICDGLTFFNNLNSEKQDSQSLCDSMNLFAANEFGSLCPNVLKKLQFVNENDYIDAVNYLIHKKILKHSKHIVYKNLENPQILTQKHPHKIIEDESILQPEKKIDKFQRFLKI